MFTGQRIGQHLEIRIGGVLVSAPVVREAIDSGCAFVGGMTAGEAAAHRATLLGASPEPQAPVGPAATTSR